jgi:hypothetical protein
MSIRSSLPLWCAGIPRWTVCFLIHGSSPSVFRVGALNRHDGLRRLAEAQFRLVEQAIHDVPVAFDPVVDELRIAVAPQTNSGGASVTVTFGGNWM